MQTLRKKTSPLKYKNETSRFLGEGVSFKAKLIGILEVSEARGDRMCQEALSDLKMAIRAAGEHKQRITINIAIDGLRLRDEKTGDSLYHHPVHKISFIAQDMSDSRAFGYIFGSPDTGHRFFGIKTDKAASQVVIAMRDLFQVVFALKKKEIEVAKQHLDKSKYSSSPLFSERNLNLKGSANDTTKISDSKGASSSNESRATPAVADLVDLELELSSLQQGLHQMERITPLDTVGRADDPFGDSFTSFQKPMLPPPPSSGRDRSNRVSESSSIFSPKTPHTAASCDSSSAADLLNSNRNTPKDFSFNEFNSSHDEPSSGDWFTPPAGNSLFEDIPSATAVAAALAPAVPEKSHEQAKQEIMSQFDVFTDLDPLGTKNYNPKIGTGKIRPYVDKKHFFQDLKNPPKKALKELVSESQPQAAETTTHFTANFTDQISDTATAETSFINKSTSSIYNNDPFGEDPFDQTDPFADSDFSKNDVFESDPNTEYKLLNNKLNDLSSDNNKVNNGNLGPIFKTEFSFASKKLFENPSVDLSSEGECAPDPPPRPANTLIKPPPLPPKKHGEFYKLPPREKEIVNTKEESHYDYIDKYRSGIKQDPNNPPLPAPARKALPRYEFQFEDDYLTPVGGPILQPPPKNLKKLKVEPPVEQVEPEPDLDLETLDITLSQLTLSGLNELASKLKIPPSQLSNMTLAQLTSYLSNFIKNKKGANDIASSSSPATVKCEQETSQFESDFADFNQFNKDLQQENVEPERLTKTPTPASNQNLNNDNSYDRYAVFRELIVETLDKPQSEEEVSSFEAVNIPVVKAHTDFVEIKQVDFKDLPNEEITNQDVTTKLITDKYMISKHVSNIDASNSDISNNEVSNQDVSYKDVLNKESTNKNIPIQTASGSQDRYAALREIVDSDIRASQDVDVIEEEMEEEDKYEEDEDENQLETIDEVPLEQNNLQDRTSSVENDLNIDIINEEETQIPFDKEEHQMVSIEMDSLKPSSRVASGSLSDVISGSSPEIDNACIPAKNIAEAGESWANFDQSNLESKVKDTKNIQSEEGVSPWSSDSKEFGNGSPTTTTDWRNHRDFESGNREWNGRRSQEWWDSTVEAENPYYNRRSTDSYEDECYDCYDRPRRRRQWSTGPNNPTTPHGGHSSSSRDVSPWEEEPRRRGTDPSRPTTWSSRHSRHSFDRHSGGRDSRRHTDSWDEEDDYEYEDERFHWPERHRDPDRHPRVGEMDDWEDRRLYQKRRRDPEIRDRWCCPDYNLEPEPLSRYNVSRRSNPERRKHDERYYSRDNQESPWEDEYSNSVEPHYLTARRSRIRPSSASEMDRKTGEIKTRPSQFHFAGSDGERERRYKTSRRSKSRDSQFAEPGHMRHKLDPITLRSQLRKQHNAKFDDFEPSKRPVVQDIPKESKPKSSVTEERDRRAITRKKSKESPKEETNTLPRKATRSQQPMFESDFVSSQPSNGSRFDNNEDGNKWFEKREQQRAKHNLRSRQKSLFEDDFSPTESKESNGKVEGASETIHSIKEEVTEESADSLGTNNFDRKNSKKRFSRISQLDSSLKKSESINIFRRENDPFDDDFFAENANDWAPNFDNTK